MTVRRWATTTVAMALVGWALLALSPGAGALTAAVGDPQLVVDTGGPDALLVPVAWVLAVTCWAWGAIGLALTALSVRTGFVGQVAGVLLGVVLPAGLRQLAAVAVGVSVATVPLVASAAPPAPDVAITDVAITDVAITAVATTDVGIVGGTADAVQKTAVQRTGSVQKTGPTQVAAWSDVAPAVPDWPSAPAGGEHGGGERVVLRGDCLWDIAADWLAQRSTAEVTPAATAAAVHAWWQANADVIGPDPDLLLPGQVLRAPAAP